MPAIDRITEPITSIEGLREVLAPPSHFVTDKDVDALDDICRDFIARSPFVLVASADGTGRLDISPKGDAPGFVAVLDDHTLAIPERLGNHRADTFTNVITEPWVALIFFVPGNRNTLRIRGKATVVRDRWLREQLVADDKVPELALVIEITNAFFHCAKCVIRSKLWDGAPEQAAERDHADEDLLARAMVRHGGLDVTVEQMQEIIVADEQTRLY